MFKKFLIAIVFIMFAQNAFAIGEREKGALMGIVGTLIIQEVDKNRSHRGHHPVHGHGTYGGHVHDQVLSPYEKGMRDRIAAEERKLEARINAEVSRIRWEAYQCGRGRTEYCH